MNTAEIIITVWSLLSHIATRLARGTFKFPVIPARGTQVIETTGLAEDPPSAALFPPVITTEDVTPPFEPPRPEKGPNECARSACKNAVKWPQYWCSDACVHAWSREFWRLTA